MKKSKAILTFSLLSMLILLIATAAFAAVEINYFQLQSWIDNVVTVEWESETQNDIAGFYIWRSDKNLPVIDGQIDTTQATLLNEALITRDINDDLHSCSSSGGLYEFPDDTISADQDTYWYYLEAQKCLSDTREFYDEVRSYEGNQPGGLEATRPPEPTPTVTPKPSGSVLYLPIIRQASTSR